MTLQEHFETQEEAMIASSIKAGRRDPANHSSHEGDATSGGLKVEGGRKDGGRGGDDDEDDDDGGGGGDDAEAGDARDEAGTPTVFRRLLCFIVLAVDK